MPERLTDKPNQHSSKGPVNKVTGMFASRGEVGQVKRECVWVAHDMCFFVGTLGTLDIYRVFLVIPTKLLSPQVSPGVPTVSVKWRYCNEKSLGTRLFVDIPPFSYAVLWLRSVDLTGSHTVCKLRNHGAYKNPEHPKTALCGPKLAFSGCRRWWWHV